MKGAFQICRTEFVDKFEFPEAKTVDGKTIIERLQDIALEREDIFRSCNWSSNPFNCSEFRMEIGEKGPCFSFNMLNSRDIYTDK